MAKMLNYYSGGEWVASQRRFNDFNPADSSVWADVADADLAAVQNAINSAHKAQPVWAALSHSERAYYLKAMGDEFKRRQPDAHLTRVLLSCRQPE